MHGEQTKRKGTRKKVVFFAFFFFWRVRGTCHGRGCWGRGAPNIPLKEDALSHYIYIFVYIIMLYIHQEKLVRTLRCLCINLTFV